MRRSLRVVLLWTVIVAATATAILLGLGAWQRAGSPGPMSPGHKDLACADCHVDWNTSTTRMNAVCLDCHEDDVGKARNAHSPAYFAIVDERETPWYLSPTNCLDCHRGHVREQRDPRVMTFMPDGYCVACHENVQERVRGPGFATDHAQFDFSSCQSCHQFHERTLFPPRTRHRR